MGTSKYQLFYVIGLTIERPYNSLELWPSAIGKDFTAGDDLPIHRMPTRHIYDYKA